MKQNLNKLKNTKCYLSGAIDRVADNGVGWRKNITPFLRAKNILVFDPCDKPTLDNKEDLDFRAKKKELRDKKDWDGLKALMKPVRRIDLRMCDEASFLIVNLDMEIHPCGTYEEIFLANRQRKPILVHCEQGKSQVPDWLFAALPHNLFFDDWFDLKEYVSCIDSGLNNDDLNGRWVFWDFK